VDRKKESAATFDIEDSKKGEAVRILISPVVTVSWRPDRFLKSLLRFKVF